MVATLAPPEHMCAGTCCPVPDGDDVESWPACLWPDEWTRQWAIEEARLQRDLDSVL